MKYLIVAHHKENIDWLRILDKSWTVLPYHAGAFESTPNSPTGCEAFAYLQQILEFYRSWVDNDVVAFCQGNPSPHCQDLFGDLDSRHYQGRLHYCSSSGLPHCTYLDLDSYCRTFDLPHGPDYPFSEGAHFKTTGAMIKSRPISFYAALRNLVNTPHSKDPKYHAMTMERLWFNVFDIKP